MNEITLIWALWVTGGGPVNGGFLTTEPRPVAYFATVEECEALRKVLPEPVSSRQWARCIGAKYLLPVRGVK